MFFGFILLPHLLLLSLLVNVYTIHRPSLLDPTLFKPHIIPLD